MNCPYIDTQQPNPTTGGMDFHCTLIAQECGYGNIFIPEARCEHCSQRDDGSSHASQAVNYALRRRVVMDWAQAPATRGRFGSMLTVEESLQRLKKRLGAQAAQKVLLDAVQSGGMPEARAVAIASECFPGE